MFWPILNVVSALILCAGAFTNLFSPEISDIGISLSLTGLTGMVMSRELRK